MTIRELLEHVVPGTWVCVTDGVRSAYNGMPYDMPERLKDLEVAGVGCDADYMNTLDVYVKVCFHG